MRPLGFPQPNVQNSQNRYNQNQGYNQNRGNNFNQGNQNYQAPFNQTQVGPSNDFSNYIKTNDVNMRAMQNQISNMKTELKNEFQTTMMNQSNELKNMMSSFFQMQSPSGSGSLPSNTIANPRGNLKAITTRSGVSYDGPTIPPTSSPLPKEVECEPEETKDKVQTTSSGSTTHAQPPVVQVPTLEPDVVPKPNPKPSIPYPSRLNDQNLREKANNQMLKFLQIFQRLHFDISFADALLHMPKFASTFKSLLSNKEKLFELENTPLNENCSAVLLKKYDDESINRIDVTDVTCEECTQEVLIFLDSSKSGNPTPSSDPIITTSSHSLTPFEGGDFILEENEAFLRSDSIPPIDDTDFDPKRDILLLEKLLNDDPSSPLPPKELHFEELKMIKSSIDDPPELELKDLPSHLEIFDIKGIDPQFCTHKILMEDDFKPAVQHQRRVNPKNHEVIKKEVIKLLDAGLIYPISDSPWKLNDATRKDHFLLPFMGKMLERLAGNEYYCFLDGFSGYFQILIDLQDQDKTTFTCPCWD
ncbi:hypothetical protein Tco_1438695 [Tanacetum coccineum]